MGQQAPHPYFVLSDDIYIELFVVSGTVTLSISIVVRLQLQPVRHCSGGAMADWSSGAYCESPPGQEEPW